MASKPATRLPSAVFLTPETSPDPSHFKMPLFKKSNKSRQPSQHLASFGIPTHIALGPLGLSADLDLNASAEGGFRSVKSGD